MRSGGAVEQPEAQREKSDLERNQQHVLDKESCANGCDRGHDRGDAKATGGCEQSTAGTCQLFGEVAHDRHGVSGLLIEHHIDAAERRLRRFASSRLASTLSRTAGKLLHVLSEGLCCERETRHHGGVGETLICRIFEMHPGAYCHGRSLNELAGLGPDCLNPEQRA